jgi:hypothetical protein
VTEAKAEKGLCTCSMTDNFDCLICRGKVADQQGKLQKARAQDRANPGKKAGMKARACPNNLGLSRP